MKNTVLTLITGLALAATAQAGTSYSAKGKEVIPPPPAPCLWSWFAGGSAGYVTGDWDEEIYTLHLGAEYKCPTSSCSHAIFLEIGYTEKDERFGAQGQPGTTPTISVDLEAEVIPITLNYKYECSITDKLNWYIGAGAGVALYDLSARNPFGPGSESDEETVFYAHAFVGLVYNVSESFEIFGGAKYIYMDDVDFFSGAPGSIVDDFSLDGGIHLELGVRFNF